MHRHEKAKIGGAFRKNFYPWAICLIAAIFYGYDFFLRITPSVMIHDLMHFFGIKAAGIGFLSAFYYYAYTPMQIPAGILVDKYRIRIILTIAAGSCALGAFLFAFVPSVPVAFLARALMGFGSAFAFVGALKLGALWLPQSQFGLYTGLATAFGTLGAMSADIMLVRAVAKYGWRDAVYMTAAMGLILTIIIFTLVRSRPRGMKRMPTAYRDWSQMWSRLLFLFKNWRFWINGFVGCFLFLPVSVFASLWGVTFLKEAYNLSQNTSATAISLIFLGTAVGGPIAGWISDRLQNRRRPILVGILITLAVTLLVIFDRSLTDFSLYILLFIMGLGVGPQILVFAIGREISPPRSTGTAAAATNFVVTIGAAIFQPFIGIVLSHVWSGTMHGTIPYYSAMEYEDALLVLPVLLLIAFFISFLLPRTGGKMQYKYVRGKVREIKH